MRASRKVLLVRLLLNWVAGVRSGAPSNLFGDPGGRPTIARNSCSVP